MSQIASGKRATNKTPERLFQVLWILVSFALKLAIMEQKTMTMIVERKKARGQRKSPVKWSIGLGFPFWRLRVLRRLPGEVRRHGGLRLEAN